MALVWRKMAGGGARMPLLCRTLSQAACTRAEFCHMSQSLYKVSSKSAPTVVVLLTEWVRNCAAVSCFLYCTTWADRPFGLRTASYVKRCRRIWRRRSAIKMGQMLNEFREKRKNIIRLKVERNNKMTTGESRSAWRLLIAPPHPLTPPKVDVCLLTWQGPNEKRWWFFSEAKKAAKLCWPGHIQKWLGSSHP